jgi:DNA-binding beta-propeller fold protein YncE
LTSGESPLYGGFSVQTEARVISKRRSARFSISLIGTALLFLWATAGAHAADRIYWGGYGGSPPKISFANLDGTGGSDLNTTGATLEEPLGVAIDVVAGRIYWANDAAPKISFANLDGSGGGDLNTTGATTNPLAGIAIHPATGRIYWANYSPDTISFASLDGSGGGDLNTTGATVSDPFGLAIEPSSGRIYWTNRAPNKISFANLDGSGGGGDLDTTGATVDQPVGVAIDPALGRIYWANSDSNKISFANLDGSGGGGDLNITGATSDRPYGVAIDPTTRRIYWANLGISNKISFANLDGSGGGDLITAGATVDGPAFPALLKAPSSAGAPAIAGGSAPGSLLSCSQGSWAPDLLGALLYRVPQTFSYQWSSNGAIATSNSIAASSVGNYQCRVTAQNQAGSASQVSAVHGIFKIGKARFDKRRGTARLPVTLPGSGELTLSGKGVVTLTKTPRAAGTVKLLVKAKAKRKKKLNRKGRVKVNAQVTFTPIGGTPGSQHKGIKLKKAVRRHA